MELHGDGGDDMGVEMVRPEAMRGYSGFEDFGSGPSKAHREE